MFNEQSPRPCGLSVVEAHLQTASDSRHSGMMFEFDSRLIKLVQEKSTKHDPNEELLAVGTLFFVARILMMPTYIR